MNADACHGAGTARVLRAGDGQGDGNRWPADADGHLLGHWLRPCFGISGPVDGCDPAGGQLGAPATQQAPVAQGDQGDIVKRTVDREGSGPGATAGSRGL